VHGRGRAVVCGARGWKVRFIRRRRPGRTAAGRDKL